MNNKTRKNMSAPLMQTMICFKKNQMKQTPEFKFATLARYTMHICVRTCVCFSIHNSFIQSQDLMIEAVQRTVRDHMVSPEHQDFTAHTHVFKGFVLQATSLTDITAERSFFFVSIALNQQRILISLRRACRVYVGERMY